jgi:hypothetical protein
LHSAIRTQDFTFFKALRAELFIRAIDHIAVLYSLVENKADTDPIVHSIDSLNAGLAYVHQDAVEFLYCSIRDSINEPDDKVLISNLPKD